MNKLLLGVLLFCACTVSAEEIVFDMSVFGYTFGRMVVTKINENDSTILYSLKAKGKTSFLWMKREDETRYEVRYRNGKLLSSDYIQIESGVTKRWTKINFDGRKYLVESSKGTKTFTTVPDYSVLALYFKHPDKRTKVFYEAESNYLDIKYKEVNTLETKAADGSRTIYYFRNGQLNELEVHLPIATVHMQRVNYALAVDFIFRKSLRVVLQTLSQIYDTSPKLAFTSL